MLLGWRIQSRTAEPDNARVPSDLAVGPVCVDPVILGVPDRSCQQEPDDGASWARKVFLSARFSIWTCAWNMPMSKLATMTDIPKTSPNSINVKPLCRCLFIGFDRLC